MTANRNRMEIGGAPGTGYPAAAAGASSGSGESGTEACRRTCYSAYGKRFLDIILSASALVVLSPLLGLVAALTRLRLGSPVLFRQVRPGRKDATGRETLFTLYKFRSMTDKRDANGNLLADGERLTRFGKTLRKTSLDELPELWNILRGDMSVIGPRPQLVRDMVFMSEEQRKRHDVRPGLSGLAQINGRNGIAWEDKLENDLRYVRRITFLKDLRIFLITILKVFGTESISFEGMATAEDYGDYLLRTGKITEDLYRERQLEARRILDGSLPRDQEPKWRYYNHALVPTTAPHETVDESSLNRKGFWQSAGGHPLFARWTTDYDCREETEWWYIIKDTPFDFADIDNRYLRQLRKGIASFDIRIIDPVEHAEALYEVQVDAVSDYPPECRLKVDHNEFVESLNDRRKGITFAAYSKEDQSMAGYAYVFACDGYVSTSVLKARPSEKHKQVNAVLVYSVLDHFREDIARGIYIFSGERTIYHPTNHQEYLEKKFAYRKVYCRLHIRYRPVIRQAVACLYLMRGVLKHLNKIRLFHQINSVLKMEEIARSCKKTGSGK